MIAIGDQDLTGTVPRMADRHDGEASAEQRVSGIGYLDLVGDDDFRRVLE